MTPSIKQVEDGTSNATLPWPIDPTETTRLFGETDKSNKLDELYEFMLYPFVVMFLAFLIALLIFYASNILVSIAYMLYNGRTEINRFQSIFQLGCAVCLAFIVAGPKLRNLLSRQIIRLEQTEDILLDDMKSHPIPSLLYDDRCRIISQAVNSTERLLVIIDKDSPLKYGVYFGAASFNLFMLLVSSFLNANYSNLILLILSFASFFPLIFEPMRILWKVLPINAALKYIDEQLSFYRDDEDEMDKLKKLDLIARKISGHHSEIKKLIKNSKPIRRERDYEAFLCDGSPWDNGGAFSMQYGKVGDYFRDTPFGAELVKEGSIIGATKVQHLRSFIKRWL